MKFDLHSLIQPNTSIDFSELKEAFTIDEMNDIVKHMPTNKSLGSDGFNGAFLKKTVGKLSKNIFYKLCSYFHEGSIYIQSINSAFITRIPKMVDLKP